MSQTVEAAIWASRLGHVQGRQFPTISRGAPARRLWPQIGEVSGADARWSGCSPTQISATRWSERFFSGAGKKFFGNVLVTEGLLMWVRSRFLARRLACLIPKAVRFPQGGGRCAKDGTCFSMRKPTLTSSGDDENSQ